MPFVYDCIDSVRSVVHARLLWQLMTLAYLVGVYFLVRRWFVHAGRSHEGQMQALLAVALLAFLPAFVTWSVQVRTDQPALAAAVWGGVLMLSTSYRRAALAGALFAVALLCTQKALYVIGLCGMLFATASAARVWSIATATRPELVLVLGRLASAAVGMIIVLGTYMLLVPEAGNLASGRAVAAGLEAMNWARQNQGYRIYTVHADRLIVHWALFVVLVTWSLGAIWRHKASDFALLASCWLALLLGLVVIRFHGSSYAYFIMTAGLFPAVALSMATCRPLARAGRMAWPVVVSLIVLAAFQSAHESVEMLADTQLEQRETMRLVHDSKLRDRRGYQVEGALFCSRDPDPLPVMFSQEIWRRFHASPKASQATADFIAELRDRPVAYFVESYRMNQFSAEVRMFFAEHYVWYARSLFVAGFNIERAGTAGNVDVIVPGAYRWVPDPENPDESIEVGATLLHPLSVIELDTGKHNVAVSRLGAKGSLLPADLPLVTRDAYPAFYHSRQILQLGGSSGLTLVGAFNSPANSAAIESHRYRSSRDSGLGGPISTRPSPVWRSSRRYSCASGPAGSATSSRLSVKAARSLNAITSGTYFSRMCMRPLCQSTSKNFEFWFAVATSSMPPLASGNTFRSVSVKRTRSAEPARANEGSPSSSLASDSPLADNGSPLIPIISTSVGAMSATLAPPGMVRPLDLNPPAGPKLRNPSRTWYWTGESTLWPWPRWLTMSGNCKPSIRDRLLTSRSPVMPRASP